MIKRYYSIENLWVIHKKDNSFRESFICQKTENGFLELFSRKYFDLKKEKFYIAPLVKYFSADMRIFYTYQDLVSLLKKFNEINYLEFIRFYDCKKNYKDNLQFVCDSLKWYKCELLNNYHLNKLYVIDLLENDKDNLYMCKYNIMLRRFIDIFTGEKILINNDESVLSLIDYLNSNNLECNYHYLDLYSLLRLYNRLNNYHNFLGYDNLDELVINKLIENEMYDKSIIYKQKTRRIINE